VAKTLSATLPIHNPSVLSKTVLSDASSAEAEEEWKDGSWDTDKAFILFNQNEL
jgi:hypothetical protein